MKENTHTEKIISRLEEYVAKRGDNFAQLTLAIGVSVGYFSRMRKVKGSLGAEVLARILTHYSDLSADWLLTGQGTMLKGYQLFDEVRKLDADFEARRQALYREGKRWRFVASLSGGKAKICLLEVDAAHPFFNLQGSDNIITLHTERYSAQPMVIKGAGAGAAVTAAGVFGDIIRVANI